ncbi:MAG: insulinase family protein, partial [Chromatiales bacterium]
MIGRRLVLLLLLLAVPLLAARPAAAMDIREVTSSAGITAWLVEDHTNPLVSVKLAFRGGPWQDPADKQGLATLTMGLLDEGAGDYDSRAFQERLQDIGAELRFDASRGHVTGSLRVLKDSLAEAGDLLRLALTEPRFEDEAVERVRSGLLASLRRDAENPERVAWWAMMARLFPDHPFGRRPDGTPETVPRITPADMRAFAKAQFARDRLIL